MDSDFNPWPIWAAYLLASGIFYWVLHKLTRTDNPSWWLYSFRAAYLALVLTPAYANQQGESLAPALMVATLDLITIGSDEFVRALTPLSLAFAVSILASTAVYFYQRKRINNK